MISPKLSRAWATVDLIYSGPHAPAQS